MIENGMRYLRGYVKIQIQGYSPERFLNLCSYHHILIWDWPMKITRRTFV